MEKDKFVTVAEAARAYGISRPTVYKWAQAGDIRYVYHQRGMRVWPDDVAAMIGKIRLGRRRNG